VLGPRRFFGVADDNVKAHEHLDVLGIAPGLHGAGADLVHLFATWRWFVLTADEHAFGVVASEQQAPIRTTGLKQHGRALRRRLAQVITLDLIELAAYARTLCTFSGWA
jgi:hypothetical protein